MKHKNTKVLKYVCNIHKQSVTFNEWFNGLNQDFKKSQFKFLHFAEIACQGCQ